MTSAYLNQANWWAFTFTKIAQHFTEVTEKNLCTKFVCDMSNEKIFLNRSQQWALGYCISQGCSQIICRWWGQTFENSWSVNMRIYGFYCTWISIYIYIYCIGSYPTARYFHKITRKETEYLWDVFYVCRNIYWSLLMLWCIKPFVSILRCFNIVQRVCELHQHFVVYNLEIAIAKYTGWALKVLFNRFD